MQALTHCMCFAEILEDSPTLGTIESVWLLFLGTECCLVLKRFNFLWYYIQRNMRHEWFCFANVTCVLYAGQTPMKSWAWSYPTSTRSWTPTRFVWHCQAWRGASWRCACATRTWLPLQSRESRLQSTSVSTSSEDIAGTAPAWRPGTRFPMTASSSKEVRFMVAV